MHASRVLFEQVKRDWPSSGAEATGIVPRIDYQPLHNRDQYFTHTDFHALYFVRRGRGIHVIDDVPYGIARGDTYVMAAGATHAYSRHDDLCLDAIYFDARSFADEMSTLALTPGFFGGLSPGSRESGKWLHLTPQMYAEARFQFDELRREWMTGSAEGNFLSRSLFIRLIISLCRARSQEKNLPTKRGESDVAVSDAIRLLEERYWQTVRIAQIAKEVGLCPDHFTVVFSAVTGRTPQNYLHHVRVEHAKRLLIHSDQSLSQIALHTGFSDSAHLSRTFMRIAGSSPGQFRRNGRQG